jgi:hypothetical protein
MLLPKVTRAKKKLAGSYHSEAQEIIEHLARCKVVADAIDPEEPDDQTGKEEADSAAVLIDHFCEDSFMNPINDVEPDYALLVSECKPVPVLDEHENWNKANLRNREPGCVYTIEY